MLASPYGEADSDPPPCVFASGIALPGYITGCFLTDYQFFCFPLRELRVCAGVVKGFIFREIGGWVKRGKSAYVSHADNQAVTRSVGNAKNLDVSKLYHNFAFKESINHSPHEKSIELSILAAPFEIELSAETDLSYS